MKRILFVDDEENVLQGLRRSLRSKKNEWEMIFCDSPLKAIALLEEEPPFDLVVSDMQMPEMNGNEFLSLVMDKYPMTARFILSGLTDSQNLFRSNAVAHQFLSKPCETLKLIALITRTCSLREHLSAASLNKKLLQMGGVPSMPKVYQQIIETIRSEDAGIADIAELIKQDVGLSTKVLQLVNSAFMGLKHHVSDIVHAASLLGVNHIRNLVLAAEIFEPENKADLSKYINLEALWNHCCLVAEYTGKIMEFEAASKSAVADAYTAGLLHEVGQIILASELPEEFMEAHAKAEAENIPLVEAEKAVFGSSHSCIGGYLLELWGLPDPVVHAIAFHDLPSSSPEMLSGFNLSKGAHPADSSLEPLTALHGASYLIDGFDEAPVSLNSIFLDEFYMRRKGVIDKIGIWFDVCNR